METYNEQSKITIEPLIKITLPVSAVALDPRWHELIQSPLANVESLMPVIQL